MPKGGIARLNLLTTILYTILVFFIIIGIHEWGHMFFAKRAGILVREFAIGFGPKLIAFKRGETKYSFRLLPFGGFARMAGEDAEIIQVNKGQTVAVRLKDGIVTHIYLDKLDLYRHLTIGEVVALDLERELYVELLADGETVRRQVDPKAMIVARGQETQIAPLDRQFNKKSVGKRAMTIFGGPLMNFVLAVFLFAAYVFMVGVPVKESGYILIMETIEGSPAEESGLKQGDQIVSIDGVKIDGDMDRLTSLISKSADKPMNWRISRGGETLELTVTPRIMQGETPMVGITMSPRYDQYRQPTMTEAAKGTWNQIRYWTNQIFIGLKKLAMLDVKLQDLGGPVDIALTTGEAARAGFSTLVLWTAILSLYLGIFNLLPVPALDGSRLMFIGLEAVRGKPISQERESLVHLIGFSALFLLMIAVTYYDILALFQSENQR